MMSDATLTARQMAWLRDAAERTEHPLYQGTPPAVAIMLDSLGMVQIVEEFDGSQNPKLKAGPLYSVYITEAGRHAIRRV